MMTLHELDLMTLFAKWRQVTALNILPYQHIKVIWFDTLASINLHDTHLSYQPAPEASQKLVS